MSHSQTDTPRKVGNTKQNWDRHNRKKNKKRIDQKTKLSSFQSLRKIQNFGKSSQLLWGWWRRNGKGVGNSSLNTGARRQASDLQKGEGAQMNKRRKAAMAHEVKCRHLQAMWELGTVSVFFSAYLKHPNWCWAVLTILRESLVLDIDTKWENLPSSWKEMLFSILNTQLGYQSKWMNFFWVVLKQVYCH